ncbi:MAG TPA: proline iminopeptidase-family hydrolase [Melioribacteraceae bacterium]|nr:proline iminopeptidase-family hydrolase [Melioribacteraceae bacterium]
MKKFLCFYFIIAVYVFGNNQGVIMKEGFVEVKGGKIWYKVVGEITEKLPILVIHGGPGVPHDYLENLEKLAQNRQVIFYDQLGCGLSEKPNDTTLWNIDRFAGEITVLLKHLNINEVVLLGQSWGSMLAVHFYLNQSEIKVNSLILSGPFLNAKMFAEDVRSMVDKLPEADKNLIFECEAKGDFTNANYQESMNKFYELHVCRINPFPDCMNNAISKMGFEVYSYMWGASEFSIYGTLKAADYTEKLHLIDIPVLFTCGEFDEATPKTTEYYSSKVKNSKFVVINNASHMHHLENEEKYIKIVNNFLNL